jgi:protein phosphatase
MKLTIPELSLVVLIGAYGSGKSTFVRQHFQATEIISSDFCRGLVSDDENDQSATKDAFDVLHDIAAKRLASGKLTVIDATNARSEDRKSLLKLAKEYHYIPVAIERQPLRNNLKRESGSFDIIGDVHECCDELETLLQTLGYERQESDSEKRDRFFYRHLQGRKAIFLGDLTAKIYWESAKPFLPTAANLSAQKDKGQRTNDQ